MKYGTHQIKQWMPSKGDIEAQGSKFRPKVTLLNS